MLCLQKSSSFTCSVIFEIIAKSVVKFEGNFGRFVFFGKCMDSANGIVRQNFDRRMEYRSVISEMTSAIKHECNCL